MGFWRDLGRPRLAAQVGQALHQLVAVREIAAFLNRGVLQRHHRRVLVAAGVCNALVDVLGQLGHRLLQQRQRVLAGPRHQRRLVGAVHGAKGAVVAQHHVRVVNEILVQRHALALAVGVGADIGPALGVGLGLLAAYLAIGALLQEDDVCSDFSIGVLGKSVVGQANGPQELDALADVLAGGVALGVQERVCHHLRQQPARAQHVHCLGEEVVVQAQAGQVLSAAAVSLGVAGERGIAHCRVEVGIVALEFGEVRLLHVLVGVQLLGNRARKRFALDGGEAPSGAHVIGHQAHEVADSGAGLQRLAARVAELAHGRVDAVLNDLLGRVVRVARGFAGRCQVGRGHQFLEFGVFLGPVGIAGVEGLGEATPADILGQDLLLIGGCEAPGLLQLGDQPNRGDIVAELGFLATFTQAQVIVNREVRRLDLRRRYGRRIRRVVFLGGYSSGWPTCASAFRYATWALYPALFGIFGVCSGSSGRNRYCSRLISQAS